MMFKNISINNFRNIENQKVDISYQDIVFEGINGQGKTNFLEAIYILCYGSSFRTERLKNCVKYNFNNFSLKGTFENEKLNSEIKIIFSENKRKIFIDEREIKDRKELIYLFPTIVFCHEDIDIIKGEPENRRRFFNQMMSLYSPSFLDNLRSYNTLLSKRNAALKIQEYSLTSLYDERLAYFGLEIMKERKECINEFNTIFPLLFSKISKTEHQLELVYQPSWNSLKDEDEIVSYLEKNKERDQIMATTTSGIHRDKFIIKSQNGNFVNIGSTGQLRLCSLLFRISEALYFNKKTKKEPILLIDDVLLELDIEKRNLVLENFPNYCQAFYTFLPEEKYFSFNKNEKIYKVVKGKING